MPGSAVATTDTHRLAVRVRTATAVAGSMRAQSLNARAAYPIPSDITAHAANPATGTAIQDHATTRGNALQSVNFPGRTIFAVCRTGS